MMAVFAPCSKIVDVFAIIRSSVDTGPGPLAPVVAFELTEVRATFILAMHFAVRPSSPPSTESEREMLWLDHQRPAGNPRLTSGCAR